MSVGFYDLYVEELAKNEKLSSDFKYLKNENLSLLNRIHYLEDNMQGSVQKAVESAVKQVSVIYESKIETLNRKVSQLESHLTIGGNNSGISTSMTPVNKNKRIPNTRDTTDKQIGGQHGHKKHKLNKFHDEEVTINLNHKARKCDACDGILIEDHIYTSKDEF